MSEMVPKAEVFALFKKLVNKDGWLLVSKLLITLMGLPEAIVYGWLVSWLEHLEEIELVEEGWFYATYEHISKDTGLSIHFIRKAVKTLVEANFIRVEMRKLPAKQYFYLPEATLDNILEGPSRISPLSHRGLESIVIDGIKDNKPEHNKNKDNKSLTTLRSVVKEAEPPSSTNPSGGRLHRRNQKDPYLNGIMAKSGQQSKLKQNRTIPSLLDSSTSDVKDVVRLWNSFGKPLTCHKPDSKVTERAVKQIQKHLTTHSLEDIKCSLRQYFELVSSSDTSIRSGVPGHVVGLDEFFGFSKLTRERMAKQKVKLNIKSWFDECLPDKDPVAKYVSEAHSIPDSHPQVTGKFKRLFVKKVLGGIVGRFTPREENCFKRASMKMVTFLKTNGGNLLLDPNERRNPLLFVNYVFDAIESQTNGNFSKVTPGWFSNDSLFTKTLPAYLHDQAMVRDFEG